jgi:hypothetical protein
MLYRKLNALVRDITAKAVAAKEAPSPADRIELLLAARDESQERMRNLERRHGDIGFAGFLGFFPGMGMMIAGTTGFLAAPSLAAVTGVLLAAPLFTAGLALAAMSLGAMALAGKAVDRLREDRDTLEKGINRAALNIIQAHPKEADKSRRYLGSLVSIYNAAAEGDSSYEKLAARVSRKAPKAASPAAV